MFPADRLEHGIVRFMLHFPVHIDPILHQARFRGRDFLQSEIMVVTVLAARGPLAPTRIAQNLNMQKGSLSSVLRRLERLGLIARRRNTADDRSYITALTPEGARFVDHLSVQRRKDFTSLFSKMDPTDVSAVARGLDLIAAHLERLEEQDMATADTKNRPKHWYYSASPEDRKEYDGFGPWAVAVKEEADMPPCFRSFYSADKDARILLKLPRKEERRALRPGMDLYRAVIAFHDAGVTLREMVDGNVESREIGWDQIVAIRCRNDLLIGHWTLLLGDGTEIDQVYNQVSSDVMIRATDFVRAHLAQSLVDSVAAEKAEDRAIEIPPSEIFFGSVLHEIERRGPEPAIPIHFEPRDAPLGRGADKPPVATGVIIIETPGELVIVNREKAAHDQEETSYASNDLFLPFARITAFAMDAPGPGDEPAFALLSLHLGRQLFRQSCRVVPDRVVAALDARGIPRVSDR